jgi:outer membrane protein OmpA-like peptidoglycan-associated protein
VAAAILLLAAGQALAQGTDTSIDVQNYRPSPGPGNYLGVIGSDVAPHVQIGFNLDFNFQSKPLVFEREDGTVSKAVDYQATLDFLWALGLFNVLQIGVALPVVIAQDGDGLAIVSEDATKLSTTAIRDLRLHLKGRLLGGGKLGGGKGGTEKDGPGLALAITMSVPTGNDENFAGDKNVTVDPVLVFDYRIKVFRFALNAGVRIRQMSKVADFDLGHQLLYGAGLGLMLVGKRLHIMAEFEGAYGLNGDTETSYRLPMEARAGVGWAFGKGKDLHLIVGAGMGFGQTPTVPEYRILASLRYAPVNRDADGDGVVDRDDLCPSDPEDRDEFDDADGCPDPDNDDDGIEDGEDECPDEAEDEDGFEDEDGCPDEDNDGDGIEDAEDGCPDEAEDEDGFEDEDGCPDADNDADGVLDADDKCPEEVEDQDGFEDGDGCPETDNDGDGFADAEDGCPDEAEDEDGFEDEDGCPDHDNDGDGVADAQDQCPDKAEVFNGIKDDDGCPDKGKALVIIEKDQIKITQQIKFKKDSAEIKAGKSLDILDVVAAILDAAPHISVEVQGHTDDTGTHEHNMKLSQERAESVVAYLVENGVDPERLVAKGYGPDEPIADNATKKGKKENRRVEFHVIDTAAATAKEEPPPADAPEPPPEEAPQPDAAPAPNKAPEPEYPE